MYFTQKYWTKKVSWPDSDTLALLCVATWFTKSVNLDLVGRVGVVSNYLSYSQLAVSRDHRRITLHK